MALSAVTNARVLFMTLLVALVLAGGFVVASLMAPAAQAQTATPVQTDPLLARGEYLVMVGACVSCHTQRAEGDETQLNGSLLLAGGRAFSAPYGTVYASNITPDVETGIGSWTVPEIVRALEEGVGRDGNELVVMPWERLRGMSTEDKVSIAFYLKSIAPISNAVPEADLRVPRAALHAEAARAPHVPGSGAAPTGTDAFDTGEYLLWNVLGCGGCHGADLKGNTPPFFAPDLTAETGAASTWTETQLVAAIVSGVRPDGSTISPAMPTGDLGYGNLTGADALAVATYLKTARPMDIDAAGPQPLPPTEGGDVVLNPLFMAALATVLFLSGLGLLRLGLLRKNRIVA